VPTRSIVNEVRLIKAQHKMLSFMSVDWTRFRTRRMPWFDVEAEAGGRTIPGLG
jgi:hypothetical protein